MTLTNSQVTTLHAAIAADKAMGAAAGTFAKRIAAMSEAGWTDAILEANKLAIMPQIAERILSKSDFALFGDDSKPQQAKGADGRQVKTARGKVVNSVHQSFARLRKALKADGETETRGPKAARDPIATTQKELDACIKRVRTDKDAESPKFAAHDELIAALTRARDLVK